MADGGYHAPECVTVKIRLRSYFGKEQVTEQKGARHNYSKNRVSRIYYVTVKNRVCAYSGIDIRDKSCDEKRG